MIEHLKYPIGKLEVPTIIESKHLINWISIIEEFPVKLEKLVQNLTNNQLDTP